MKALGEIEVRLDGDLPVVVLSGEFDLANHEQLRQQFECFRESECRHVVLDLSDTQFIDSTALGAIVNARQNGLRFTVRGAGGMPRKTLEVSGVAALLEMDD